MKKKTAAEISKQANLEVELLQTGSFVGAHEQCEFVAAAL